MPLTKQLSIAIIDSNPALSSRQCFNKNAIPDPRVSTVTPSTISFFKGNYACVLPASEKNLVHYPH